VALAMHDATIATWESKYAYNRQRPSERDHRLPTALPVPNSPSYPSEHAAAAQAAASDMEIQLLAGHSPEKWGAILERVGRNGPNTKTAVRHEATLFP